MPGLRRHVVNGDGTARPVTGIARRGMPRDRVVVVDLPFFHGTAGNLDGVVLEYRREVQTRAYGAQMVHLVAPSV